MGKTLGIAGEKQAYVISDRATYLAFQKTIGLAILLEGDPVFLNVYHVMEVNPDKFPKVNAKGGKAFADFLYRLKCRTSETFGVDCRRAAVSSRCGGKQRMRSYNRTTESEVGTIPSITPPCQFFEPRATNTHQRINVPQLSVRGAESSFSYWRLLMF